MTIRTDWRDDASCRDADADLFFPVGTMAPALRQRSSDNRTRRSAGGLNHGDQVMPEER